MKIKTNLKTIKSSIMILVFISNFIVSLIFVVILAYWLNYYWRKCCFNFIILISYELFYLLFDFYLALNFYLIILMLDLNYFIFECEK